MKNEYSQTVSTTVKKLGKIAPCYIFNDGSYTVYWGADIGITTSDGHPIPCGTQAYFNKKYKNTEICVISSASTTIKIAEVPK